MCAGIIFDKYLNPYLFELNSGWLGYINKKENYTITKLKINTGQEIFKIVYNSINNIPIIKIKTKNKPTFSYFLK